MTADNNYIQIPYTYNTQDHFAKLPVQTHTSINWRYTCAVATETRKTTINSTPSKTPSITQPHRPLQSARKF
jgi:hypothetical protein